MTVDDAMDVARSIFSLYDSVIHALYEKNQTSADIAVTGNPVVLEPCVWEADPWPEPTS